MYHQPGSRSGSPAGNRCPASCIPPSCRPCWTRRRFPPHPATRWEMCHQQGSRSGSPAGNRWPASCIPPSCRPCWTRRRFPPRPATRRGMYHQQGSRSGSPARSHWPASCIPPSHQSYRTGRQPLPYKRWQRQNHWYQSLCCQPDQLRLPAPDIALSSRRVLSNCIGRRWSRQG